MNCKQVQSELSAYLDGEVTAELRGEIDVHIGLWPHCQQRVTELKRLVEGVAALPKVQPAPQFLMGVRRKIARGEEAREQTWIDALFRPALAKAAD